jgi:hypothetical protein
MELFLGLAVLAFVGLVALGLLKMLIWLLVLPLQIAAWVLKGVLGLILLVPIAIIGICAASVVLPIAFGVLVLPVIFVVLGIIGLVKLIV